MTHTTRLPSPSAARRARSRGPARAGFTLIELLVVVVIIGVLIGLGAGAAQRIRVTMYVKASGDTVAKCQSALDDQIKRGINPMVAKESTKPYSNEFSLLLTYCEGDPDRAAALLTYCRIRQYFPTTQADLATPSFTVGGATFYRPLGMQQLNGLTGNPHYVSAAILHTIASKRTLGGLTFETDVGLSGAQTDVGPPDLSTTRRVFKDSWGNPIGFALITEVQLPELRTDPRFTHDPNNPPGRRDPFDPQGKLYGWANTTNKNAAQAALGVTFDGCNKWLIAYSSGANRTYDTNFGGDEILGHRTKATGPKGTQ
jgi:prepilin-type N-terminal cleavage/methylation domain-containing protein